MWDVFPKPDCRGSGAGAKPYGVTPSPNDPIGGGYAAEGMATAFADRVRGADLIALVETRTLLPPRWTTSDGARQENPHLRTSRGYSEYTIITPERVNIITIAKGDYRLPSLYLAYDGGKIGQDCISTSNSLDARIGPIGTKLLYLTYLDDTISASPVNDDARYRFYRVSRIYSVSPDSTITIGPESDIMRNRRDDPPRILTVEAVLAEIAALLAAPQ